MELLPKSPGTKRPRTPESSPRKKRADETVESPSSSHRSYSTNDDLLYAVHWNLTSSILTMRQKSSTWDEVASFFPGRTATAIRLHHDKHLKHLSITQLAEEANRAAAGGKSGYSPSQDRLIILLKEIKKLKWDDMALLFPGKSGTALRLHYAKLKRKSVQNTTDIEEVAE